MTEALVTLEKESGKVIPEEHERRFTLNLGEVIFPFAAFPKVFITQGYLEDPLRTRVRDEMEVVTGKHTYTTTRKSGSGVSRPEDEGEITKDRFDELWSMVRYSLNKIRYFVTYDGVSFQFNIFTGHLKDFAPQIEIEFDSHEEAVAFIPPPWFGREVTDDPNHSNYSLAKFGAPQE